MAEVFCASELPFAYGLESLHLGDGDKIPWPDPGELSASRTQVTLAGRAIMTAASELQARAVVEELRAIAGAARKERAKVIAAVVAKRLSTDSILKDRESQATLRKALAAASFAAFAGWFVLLPVSTFLLPEAMLSLLAALALVHVAVLTLSAKLLRVDGGKSKRLPILFPMALFPPTGARAGSHVSREQYSDKDPAALAVALLPVQARVAFLRQAGERAAQEQRASADTDTQPFFAARAAASSRLAEENEIAKTGAARPAIEAVDAATFCPACAQQYRPGYARCADCDMALLPLSESP